MVSDVGHIDEKVFQEYYAQAAKTKGITGALRQSLLKRSKKPDSLTP
jgi:hypothetical protein